MIAETFVVLFVSWVIWYAWSVYVERRNMPPGPFPFPFFGNIPQLLLTESGKSYSKLADKYGDIYTITLPGGNAVVLNTASLVREARLSRKDEDLAGRVPDLRYPADVMLGDDLAFADYSPVFRFRRKVFLSAVHGFGSGLEQIKARAGHAVKMALKELETMQGRPFSPKIVFQSSIIVQLWEWVTSKKVALDDPVVAQISEFSELFTKQAHVATLYQLFPFMRYIPTNHTRSVNRAINIRTMLFPPEYRAHLKTYTNGLIRDLTDSFIRAYDKESAKEITKDIGSKDDIPGLMLDVLFAGSETTSTILTWFFVFMVLHPNVQKKIHEELDNVVGRDRFPSFEDARNTHYLQASLCETIRASSAIPGGSSNAIRDMKIGAYHIPKGTLVILNLSKLHRDEREWSEPEKFNPERFLDFDGKFVGWNKLHGFLPFAVGKRECPGQKLAKIMIFTFASFLLQRYKIELPEGVEKPTIVEPAFELVVKPKNFWVIAKPRIV